jgi:hypothetical protein
MKQPHSIETYKQIAIDREGKCLSDIYVNSQTKLKWECKNGHVWEAIPSAVKRGQWCKKCSDNERAERLRREGFEEAIKYALSKKGKCISDTYINSHTPLKWECEKGHQWKTSFSSMKSGNTWCPHCSNRAKLTIELMREIAANKNGRCLSEKYINVDTKLLWVCEFGHKWESIPYLIKNGSWCPTCASLERANKQRSNINEIQKLASKRGGKCLSTEYINAQKPLLWECNNGHQWKTSANNVQQGKWCPKCSSGLGERICREFFEQLFNTEFVKVYPSWLINESGNQMELDGFSDKYNLAFEHQGGQHYYVDGFFIKTKEQLKKRQIDDALKKDLCEKKNVSLIAVPEIPKHLKVEKIKEFIKGECNKNDIPLPLNFDTIDVDLLKAYTPEDSLEELQQLAKSKGGLCLSDSYLGTQSNMLWECKLGHRWSAIPNRIKRGSWCPICAGNTKLSIDEMKDIASTHNGKCLSTEYINNNTPLLWECSESHKFKARPDNVKGGTWCPECRVKARADSQRGNIEEMQELALERNGKCLSTEYVTTHTKLTWKCDKEHTWNATPSQIKTGSWCPVCNGNVRPTIEDMRELALQKNGKCLSDKYVSTHTKLLWECERGHQWEARPSGVKRGAWCPICAGNIKLTIEDMQKLAEKKGGKCLSENYVNIDTKLLWECEIGHQWETIPYLIRTGSWCPICGHEKKKKSR